MPEPRPRRLLAVAAGLILLAVLGRGLLGRPVRVASGAMAPALLPGDLLWVDRSTDANPGEIVAWQRQPGELALGRVVAGPGQVVEVADRSLWVDGQRVVTDPGLSRASPPARLQSGEFFLLGDAPAAASDSRQWGPVRQADLRGRARCILWPSGPRGPGRWQRLLQGAR